MAAHKHPDWERRATVNNARKRVIAHHFFSGSGSKNGGSNEICRDFDFISFLP